MIDSLKTDDNLEDMMEPVETELVLIYNLEDKSVAVVDSVDFLDNLENNSMAFD